MNAKLLILDNDTDSVLRLKSICQEEHYELFQENDGSLAASRVIEVRPHVAIIEIGLTPRSGIDILKEVKKIDAGLAVIMTTGNKTTQNAIESMKHGAFDYVTKPFDMHRLKTAVKKALECNLLSRKVRYTREAVEGDSAEDLMIGSSPEMIEIWKMVGAVADSDASVLIQGESGTGKELLARAIYDNSRRKNRPFLAVNCAALPETLLESELFGHEKGAFTDAHSRRIGKFEQCTGGTIFLDEVSELSPASQGKFLRVLENQEFERVGGDETIKVDVRVISATNRSLLALAKEKTFRMDLFYRLRVVKFFLPPLRDRAEDIPLLVDLFVRKFSKLYGKNIRGVSPKTMAALRSHPFEGNIRELKNMINSAVVLCRGTTLVPGDFESSLMVQAGCKVATPETAQGEHYEVFRSILEPVFDRICQTSKGAIYESLTMGLEKALISMAMEKSHNNQVFASKLLGISRNTLRDRLLRY